MSENIKVRLKITGPDSEGVFHATALCYRCAENPATTSIYGIPLCQSCFDKNYARFITFDESPFNGPKVVK